MLSGLDLSLDLDLETYQRLLKRYHSELKNLALQIYKQRRPVVIVFEGCRVSGKPDIIRCVVEELDPRGFVVYPAATPTETEANRHYLWQFWQRLPEAGQIAIFDRSWYGRVMDERLNGRCSNEECKRAYREINSFERQLLDFGTVIVKFWLHIDYQERERRLGMLSDVDKHALGIPPEDWCSQDKWESYKNAADEMLLKTGSLKAPWTVVESNSELYARIKTLKTLVVRLKVELQNPPSKASAKILRGSKKRKKKRKKK